MLFAVSCCGAQRWGGASTSTNSEKERKSSLIRWEDSDSGMWMDDQRDRARYQQMANTGCIVISPILYMHR